MSNEPQPLDKELTLERYRFITSQCVQNHEKVLQSFNLYLKIYSTIFAGILWLRFQPKWFEVWTQVFHITLGLVLMLAVATSLMIYRYTNAWWNFRIAESKITNGIAPLPEFPKSCFVEIMQVVFVWLTTGIGWWAIFQLR